MAGIYVHIPFCRQACTYCDFHFSTNLSRQDEMVAAILHEAELRFPSWGAFPDALTSLYLGGGTPSILPPAQIARLLDGLTALWPLAPDAETTIECNPDDLTPSALSALRAAGVNRLSIGIQSFRDQDLALMNRSHNATQALRAISDAQAAGFDNITIDLIYGIPGQTLEDWDAQLQRALDTGVPHISAYALTVEDKTALHHQVKKGLLRLPAEEAYTSHYLHLVARLTAAGYDAYELSNFGKPGYHARHNTAYWHGAPYLGLGPSAHSFDGNDRFWNVAHNTRYLQQLAQGKLPEADRETLTPQDRLNEYLMTGLRLSSGIDLDLLKSRWGLDLAAVAAAPIAAYQEQGWMVQQQGRLQLTPAGKMVSDRIISELFQV